MPSRKPIKISRRAHVRLIWFSFVATCFLFVLACSVTAVVQEPAMVAAVSGNIELPYYEDGAFVIHNRAGRYVLSYDTLHRQARWVAYVLTRAECASKKVDRQDRFVPDPEVVSRSWPTARTSDYAKSGFDRGHLLPSADRDDGVEENAATFYLSNVAPQTPSLNRKAWKALEEKVREWAVRHDSLYVVTGSIISDDPTRIKGGVAVPDKFYKALLVRSGGEWFAAAFVMPNAETVEGGWSLYMFPVRQLEDSTGIDFFHNMPDGIEDRIETVVDAVFWH